MLAQRTVLVIQMSKLKLLGEESPRQEASNIRLLTLAVRLFGLHFLLQSEMAKMSLGWFQALEVYKMCAICQFENS